MEAARALFIWKAVSGDSTAMRTGAERIGTGRTGSEGTGTEPIKIERTGIERTGIGGIWNDGTWAIGTSRPASATMVEGLRASRANGTSKVTPAETLNLSQCGNWRSRNVAMGQCRHSRDFQRCLLCPQSRPSRCGQQTPLRANNCRTHPQQKAGGLSPSTTRSQTRRSGRDTVFTMQRA